MNQGAIAAELRELRQHPHVQRAFARQESDLQQVVSELMKLGRCSFAIAEDWALPVGSGRDCVCALRLRAPATEHVAAPALLGTGATPLIAALRCFIVAGNELERDIESGLDDLRAWMQAN